MGGWQCRGYRPGLTDVFTDGIVRAYVDLVIECTCHFESVWVASVLLALSRER